MKKLLAAFLFAFAFALPASASMNSDFADHFSVGGLADYNRDISTMIGLADFHTGKGVTFPGFDIGASVSAVKTSSGYFSSEDYLYAPFITAETQLPILGMDIALRGTQYDGFKSLGGGLKWHGSLALINLSAAAFYDRYGTDYYDGDHYSVSASASVNILFLTPYVGIGYDYSELSTKGLDNYRDEWGNIIGNRSTSDGVVRYTAGVNFHPLPLFYVYGAYTYTKYSQGFQGGIGLNF